MWSSLGEDLVNDKKPHCLQCLLHSSLRVGKRALSVYTKHENIGPLSGEADQGTKMIHAAPLFTTSEASLLQEELNIFITYTTYLGAQGCLQGSESELMQIKNKDRVI